ncbi:radical SAM protein [Cetobacterium sp.]|uniref:radical SAM protein n=1 Tax=Cetobacterium sp. TaxID=2071632 RepID=UPI003F38757A
MYTLEVSLTTNCNLSCYYCFAKNNDGVNSLKIEEFNHSLKIIKDLIKEDNLEEKDLLIKIYGGEPLLHKNLLKEILNNIKEFQFNNKEIKTTTAIITNGTLLNEDFSNFINEINKEILVKLNFSLELNEKFQDKIRSFKNGKETFNIILENIKSFKKINGLKKVNIQTVMSPDFLKNADSYISFVEKYKNDFNFSILPMFDKTFNKENIYLIEKMKLIFDYYNKKIEENDYYHINFFQIYRSFANSYYYLNSFNLTHCTAGNKTLSVMPDKILACSKLHYKKKKYKKYENLNDFKKTRKMYGELTKYDLECYKCMSKNKNFGCLGVCLCEGKSEFVCSYNKKFGILTKNFLFNLKNNEDFLKYFQKNYFKNKISLKELKIYLEGDQNI